MKITVKARKISPHRRIGTKKITINQPMPKVETYLITKEQMAEHSTAEDIGRICHGHPTFSEALKEAALGAWDQAIHG